MVTVTGGSRRWRRSRRFGRQLSAGRLRGRDRRSSSSSGVRSPTRRGGSPEPRPWITAGPSTSTVTSRLAELCTVEFAFDQRDRDEGEVAVIRSDRRAVGDHVERHLAAGRDKRCPSGLVSIDVADRDQLAWCVDRLEPRREPMRRPRRLPADRDAVEQQLDLVGRGVDLDTDRPPSWPSQDQLEIESVHDHGPLKAIGLP